MTKDSMRDEFEQHIKNSIDSEFDLPEALELGADRHYNVRWVFERWVAWHAATIKERERVAREAAEPRTVTNEDVAIALSGCDLGLNSNGEQTMRRILTNFAARKGPAPPVPHEVDDEDVERPNFNTRLIVLTACQPTQRCVAPLRHTNPTN